MRAMLSHARMCEVFRARLFKVWFGRIRDTSKILFVKYELNISDLNEAMEYGCSFSLIMTFATFSAEKDAL